MNTLLLFFALPIAVIIISIALQKILECPFLVAGVIFSIFLVVTFVLENNLIFLVATIVYTMISFITAILVNTINNANDDNNNNDNNNDININTCGCSRRRL